MFVEVLSLTYHSSITIESLTYRACSSVRVSTRPDAVPSVGRGRPHPEPRGHRHEIRKRVGLHLAHDLPSVCFHRDLTDAEFSADLLIQQTGDDERHHLSFARRE